MICPEPKSLVAINLAIMGDAYHRISKLQRDENRPMRLKEFCDKFVFKNLSNRDAVSQFTLAFQQRLHIQSVVDGEKFNGSRMDVSLSPMADLNSCCERQHCIFRASCVPFESGPPALLD